MCSIDCTSRHLNSDFNERKLFFEQSEKLTDELIRENTRITVKMIDEKQKEELVNKLHEDAAIRRSVKEEFVKFMDDIQGYSYQPTCLPKQSVEVRSSFAERNLTFKKESVRSNSRKRSAGMSRKERSTIKRLTESNYVPKNTFDKLDFEFEDNLRQDTHQIDKYLSLQRTWLNPKKMKKSASKSTLSGTELYV